MRALALAAALLLPLDAIAQEAFVLEVGGDTHLVELAAARSISFGRDGSSTVYVDDESREWLARATARNVGKTLTIRYGNIVATRPRIRGGVPGNLIHFGSDAPRSVHDALLRSARSWSTGER